MENQNSPLTPEQVTKVLSKLSFAVNTPSYVLPVSLELKHGKILTWGEDNLYPQWLWKMFTGSALHNAIVLRKKNEIVANGLFSISGNPKLTTFVNDECNRKGEAFQDIFKKIVLDYLIFGGFALQVIYTKATGKIAEIYYQDYSRFRYNIDANKIKYAKNWAQFKVKTIQYDLYDKQDPTGNKIFVYNGELTRDLYALPEYLGALPYIEAQCEIANYNLQNIKNGMAPSMLITMMNNIPAIEEQASIERGLINKFTGSQGAGKIVVAFTESEQPTIKIEPIEQNNANERYLNLQEATVSNIFTGSQVTTPSIFGQQQSGKLGIAGEIQEGYQVFQHTYVQPNQKILLRIINRLLSVNFANCDLQIQPLDPINMQFTDQVLIASQMSQKEIRIQLKKQGLIDTVDFANDEKPISEVDIIPKLDTTDKEVAAGPGANKNGADADQAGNDQNGQN